MDVQVHYPLFAHVGQDKFASYEAIHTHRITLLVAPLMIAEAVLTTSACLQPIRSLWHERIGELGIDDCAALFRLLLLLSIWVRSMFVELALNLATGDVACYSTTSLSVYIVQSSSM